MIPFHHQEILIHFKIAGQGRPVVFLHGFLEDHQIYNTISTSLNEKNIQSILIDLPCHGKSNFEGEICTMKKMAAAVYELLHSLKIVDCFVVGHSMGGYVALELARLSNFKIVLFHSNFWEDNEQKKQDRNRVVDAVQKNKNIFIQEAIPNLFASENITRTKNQINELIAEAKNIAVSQISAATKGMRDRIAAYDVLENNQVFIIQGDKDPIIQTEVLINELQKIRKKIPLYSLKNCGHMGFIECPEQVISTLENILFQ